MKKLAKQKVGWVGVRTLKRRKSNKNSWTDENMRGMSRWSAQKRN